MESSVWLFLLCGLVPFASAQFKDHVPVSTLDFSALSGEEELIDELLKMNASQVFYLRKNSPETVKFAMDASKKNAAYCRHFCEIMGSFTPFLNVSPIIREEVLHNFMKRLFRESIKVTQYCNPGVRFMEMVIRAAESIKAMYMKYEDETSCFGKLHTTTPASEPTTDELNAEETLALNLESASESEVSHSNEYKGVPYHDESEVDRAGDIEALSQAGIFDKIFLKSAMKETKAFPDQEADEIIAEEDEYPLIGSIRGIPGEHYPNYTDVPITSFSCADKNIPGLYADLETGCQVFHVCFEHRRESFLCPVGTIFNQPILACDYWYSSNCSLAPMYFGVNVETGTIKHDSDLTLLDDLVIPSSDIKEVSDIFGEDSRHKPDFGSLVKLLPVKAKVSVFEDSISKTPYTKPMTPKIQDVDAIADDIFNKLLMTTSGVVSKTRDVVQNIPAPIQTHLPIKTDPINLLGLKMKLAPHSLVKAKVAATVPIAAAKATVPLSAKVAALPLAQKLAKAALLPSGKAKLVIPAAKVASKLPSAAAKKAVTVAKVASKLPFAAVKKVVPVAKVIAAKGAVPLTKGKILAASPAFLKSVALKTLPKAKIAAPFLKTMGIKSALPLKKKLSALPLGMGKIPLIKAKVAKFAISPFTKKALALGYMKLLKAKKFAVMG